ncbi:MAG TPA: alpha/beta fold hydrolase [Chloroflexota bacterium]
MTSESLSAQRRRTLRLSSPIEIPLTTGDGVRLLLTRYQGGTKGPVILSHAFGTSSLLFSVDTIDTNLAEFLFSSGYDVWLLDWRCSPKLPSAGSKYTIDDVATQDYPAAVNKVREVTGSDSTQVVAHCVGSMTFLMAQMAGLQGVRSAVCSVLTTHPVSPVLNQVKATANLASLLRRVGVETMDTEFARSRADWKQRTLEKIAQVYPMEEPCDNPICRRVVFIYGESYKHSQLNKTTHDAIGQFFGIASLTALKQLGIIVREGHVVDKNGKNAYLPHLDRLAIPIAFIHGADNHIFFPRGSEITYDMLRDANGDDLYTRHVIPDYAHMDLFVGKDTSRDVYPTILQELEKHNASG